jgi:hypothetical protein
MAAAADLGLVLTHGGGERREPALGQVALADRVQLAVPSNIRTGLIDPPPRLLSASLWRLGPSHLLTACEHHDINMLTDLVNN